MRTTLALSFITFFAAVKAMPLAETTATFCCVDLVPVSEPIEANAVVLIFVQTDNAPNPRSLNAQLLLAPSGMV